MVGWQRIEGGRVAVVAVRGGIAPPVRTEFVLFLLALFLFRGCWVACVMEDGWNERWVGGTGWQACHLTLTIACLICPWPR